jgi:glucoamylase
MTELRGKRDAFGQPGMPPRWARGAKDGVGTAYSTSSRIWFTLWNGVVTEIFYPTVDRPQTRDLQFLVTDGKTFFHEEKRDMHTTTTPIAEHVLGYRIENRDRDRRYSLIKEVIADPHQPCVLQRVRLSGEQEFLSSLRLYVLCAPHLAIGGNHNNGYVVESAGRQVLAAEKHGTWLALAADIPFWKASAGYVGASDGWTDLHDNRAMDWEFDRALDGNVALTGELAIDWRNDFTVGIAFGESLHSAVATLFQSLEAPFTDHRRRYIAQWQRACADVEPLEDESSDGGLLYHNSYSLLMAHEDKTYQGALIASMSIPWGEAKGDEDMGGYHLVWTRDMVNSAAGLLAAGNVDTPLRALVFLAVSQYSDGGFPQNFWLTGEPHWVGVQLDQVAFPVLLVWRLREIDALRDFDPYSMVHRAAGFLIRHGPATQQERWEEASGYSPSTLAASIAALICAAEMMRERGDESTARFVEEYADFLEANVERWTVTSDGALVPGIRRHYIRIHPVDILDPRPGENPDLGVLTIDNRLPGSQRAFPAKDVVDAGFLELVRYGLRSPGDPLVEDSLRVVDAVLKADTPLGPAWRRYNHDGYGQRADGSPYTGSGQGRAWPLLTGERGHYELAAGRDAAPLIRAIERFASSTGLLPEQVWDESERPAAFMFPGRPTGAAMPLMWAHSEYIRLLRSARDGQVFDRVGPVAERYLKGRGRAREVLEIWKFNRQVASVRAGQTLRILAGARFILRWSPDRWSTSNDTYSAATSIGVHYVDLHTLEDQAGEIRFTFRWVEPDRWEGRDYSTSVVPA